MIIKWWKKQKQVVIKHKAKIYSIQKHSILPWIFGVNSTNREMEWNQGFITTSMSLKVLIEGPNKARGFEKNRKKIRGGSLFGTLEHLARDRSKNSLEAIPVPSRIRQWTSEFLNGGEGLSSPCTLLAYNLRLWSGLKKETQMLSSPDISWTQS